jgi:hypothetical protein
MTAFTDNYVIRQPTLVTDFSATTGMTLTQGTGSVALDTTSTAASFLGGSYR